MHGQKNIKFSEDLYLQQYLCE